MPIRILLLLARLALTSLAALHLLETSMRLIQRSRSLLLSI